jgi:hypothetical protein
MPGRDYHKGGYRMTLGDFRKIVEQYPDECSLQIRTEGEYGRASSDVVSRVIITTVDPVEGDESSIRPWIEVQA